MPKHRGTKPAADPSGNPLVHEPVETGHHSVAYDAVQHNCRNEAQNQQADERRKIHTYHRCPPSIPLLCPGLVEAVNEPTSFRLDARSCLWEVGTPGFRSALRTGQGPESYRPSRPTNSAWARMCPFIAASLAV